MIPSKRKRERGFTLIELVVAMGIVAILAGAIVPMVFRQLIQARVDATLNELNSISDGLLKFYDDTGRFPTEDEGLAVPAEDSGDDNWQGPYLGGGDGLDSEAISKDQFGEDYSYDFEPKLRPDREAEAIVISKGPDMKLDMGSIGKTWVMLDAKDDIYVLVSAGQVKRDKIQECEAELLDLAEASRDYYLQNSGFPGKIKKLAGSYLDPGMNDDAFLDPWGEKYTLEVIEESGKANMLNLLSSGADREDDKGKDDDLIFEVNGEPLGRKITLRELEIAQALLNTRISGNDEDDDDDDEGKGKGGKGKGGKGKGGKDDDGFLSGNWNSIRKALGLDDSYKKDGWGYSYGVNKSSWTIYSVGPDGNAKRKDDNIPKGVGP